MADKEDFCPRCREWFLSEVAKRGGNDPKVYVDPRMVTTNCKIPQFTSDYCGNPIVRIFNCKVGKFETYQLKDYNAKKKRGEL